MYASALSRHALRLPASAERRSHHTACTQALIILASYVDPLLIPLDSQHYTFYEFIVSKARGKSGPLFSFDVHDDVRMVSDATVEKDESHAGKIVERGWYNRNKHVFPSNRWETYDPEKDYGSYSIKDSRKQDKK